MLDPLTLATWAVFLATALLVGVGWYQVVGLRRENRLERTLAACIRYESDPVVEGCVRRLRQAMDAKTFDGAERKYRHDIIVLLNYLDTIAIGVRQGLYDENLAYDHTEQIVAHWHETLLNCGTSKAAGINLRDYDRLCRMAVRWANAEPRFGRRWWQSWPGSR